MKKLGIIGGAGPLASALFYETMVHECYRLGRPLPEIVLLNYPFMRTSKVLNEELSSCVVALEKGGADAAVLVCNTLHLELEKIEQKNVHFFSIPELVLGQVKKGDRLLLLATEHTCRSCLYGFNISLPSSEGQKVVNRVIENVLEGKITLEDAQLLEQLIANFPEEIDGVILGCTDLPVLHHHFPLHCEKPIYDSVKIPAKTILEYL
ncbi:MAG: aspartate/glutamate racemase family protein [Verrucomicrobia bacterium]|nr:aspartate/glutamate racemase family protein [Verrucomicrobiota bacterium]